MELMSVTLQGGCLYITQKRSFLTTRASIIKFYFNQSETRMNPKANHSFIIKYVN